MMANAKFGKSGSTVVVDGAVENGRATLTLPTPCYAYPGRFSLVIKASQSGSVNTIFWAEGAVGRCTTDTVVDPGEVLPTLDQLLAQIDAMEEATAQTIAAREDMQQELSGLGVMHRTTHTGSKTIVLKDVIPSGSSIYFRPVSCTDAAVTGLTIYGMYGASASEGYDTLKANCPYGTTQVFTASREYHHLQLAPFPAMAASILDTTSPPKAVWGFSLPHPLPFAGQMRLPLGSKSDRARVVVPMSMAMR